MGHRTDLVQEAVLRLPDTPPVNNLRVEREPDDHLPPLRAQSTCIILTLQILEFRREDLAPTVSFYHSHADPLFN
jgi:hypothetical protein